MKKTSTWSKTRFTDVKYKSIYNWAYNKIIQFTATYPTWWYQPVKFTQNALLEFFSSEWSAQTSRVPLTVSAALHRRHETAAVHSNYNRPIALMLRAGQRKSLAEWNPDISCTYEVMRASKCWKKIIKKHQIPIHPLCTSRALTLNMQMLHTKKSSDCVGVNLSHVWLIFIHTYVYNVFLML